jgi:RPA family protein
MSDAGMFAQNMAQAWRLVTAKRAQKRLEREQEEKERQARERAEQQAAAAEQQRQKWFEQVERQMARGTAGNASREHARAALRGRGGRPNPLDDTLF